MKNNKFLKLITCAVLVVSMLMSCVFVMADDAEDEAFQQQQSAAIAAGQAQLDAITDFSTYGAFDKFETAATTYLGANSFSDVEDADLLQALGLLSQLGIMQGNDEGKFLPDDSITRAEYVTTILRFMNVDVDAVTGAADKEFYDVAEDNIFYKEIYAAVNLGIINGFQDNTFRPDAEISAEDALVILVRTMGYAVPAQDKGGYPHGYVYQAGRVGITAGLDLANGVALKRSEAAFLLYNSLDVVVADPVAYGSTYVYKAEETALYKFFDMAYAVGKVDATSLTGVDGQGAMDEGFIMIDGETMQCDMDAAVNYLGYQVKYYYDDSNLTMKKVVYMEKTEDNREITIQARDIVSFNDYTYTYYENGKQVTATVTQDHAMIYNGVQKMVYSEADMKPANGYVKLLSSGSGSFNTVFVSTFYNIYVKNLTMDGSNLTVVPDYNVTALTFDMSKVKVELYDANGRIDMSTSVSDGYDADGNKIKVYTMPPIPKNSLLSVFSDDIRADKNGHFYVGEDATYIKCYINSASVDGTVKSIAKNQDGTYRQIQIDTQVPVVVEGEEVKMETKTMKFEVSNDNYFDTSKKVLAINDNGTFWMDFDGRLAAVTEAPADVPFQYGYIVSFTTTGDFTKTMKAKIYTLKDEFIEYTATKVKLNGTVEKDMGKLSDALKQSAEIIWGAGKTTLFQQPIKFKADGNNEIFEMQTVTADTGVAPGIDENNFQKSTGGMAIGVGHNGYFSDNVWVKENVYFGDASEPTPNTTRLKYGYDSGSSFVVPETESTDEEQFDVIIPWLPDNDETKSAAFYDVDDNMRAGLMVMYTKVSTGKMDIADAIVEYIGTAVNDKGDLVSVLYGYNGFGAITYYGKSLDTFDGLKYGDYVYCYGTSKEVTKYDYFSNVIDVIESVDMDTQPDTVLAGDLYFSMYEVYSVVGRNVCVQTGPRTKDNQRDYRRTVYWTDNANVLQHGGLTITYYRDRGEMDIKVGSPTDLRGASEYGHEGASWLWAGEGSGRSPKFMIAINFR